MMTGAHVSSSASVLPSRIDDLVTANQVLCGLTGVACDLVLVFLRFSKLCLLR